MLTGDDRLRDDMAETIERRYALIEGEYKEEYSKDHETSRFARATDPHLNESTPWEKVVEYQIAARKVKYENFGIGASFFYYLKKTMFGENRDVPPEEMGQQKEWDAKRAVMVRGREEDEAESPREPEKERLVKAKEPGRRARD